MKDRFVRDLKPDTVGWTPLPQINWITENPATLFAEIIFICFDPIHTRLGGDVCAGGLAIPLE